MRAAIVVIVGALALAGCGNQGVRDLEGVPQTEPDKVRLVTSVDTYPNMVAMCVEGAGFASTTRDNSPAALQHIPTWDAPDGWCGSEDSSAPPDLPQETPR